MLWKVAFDAINVQTKGYFLGLSQVEHNTRTNEEAVQKQK